MNQLDQAREDFISQWGALGSNWGVNRTMAQIHALLLVSPEALTTDDVMEALAISRGNANMNLRELVQWGLIRSVHVKGERKERFEADKEVWRIFKTIIRERRRREIEPALDVLSSCRQATEGLEGEDAKSFNEMMGELEGFVRTASSLMDRASSLESNTLFSLLLKGLK